MAGFVHVEIPTKDLKRAKVFYGKVFGWNFTDFGKEYTLFRADGGTGGGIYKVKKVPTKPVVQAYIGVDNLDAKLKEIKAARGKVLKPKTEIPNMGWWASFADNQGTVLFLWEPRPQSTQPM
ncbi:MAG: VOC family protein [Armatimonadota bacterium]